MPFPSFFLQTVYPYLWNDRFSCRLLSFTPQSQHLQIVLALRPTIRANLMPVVIVAQTDLGSGRVRCLSHLLPNQCHIRTDCRNHHTLRIFRFGRQSAQASPFWKTGARVNDVTSCDSLRDAKALWSSLSTVNRWTTMLTYQLMFMLVTVTLIMWMEMVTARSNQW